MFESGARRLTIAVIAVVLGGAGCAEVRGDSSTREVRLDMAEPTRLPVALARQKIGGGSPAEEKLLAAIVSGLGQSSITKLTFVEIPPGWHADESLRATGDRWLRVEVESEYSGQFQVRAWWDAVLVVGAFRDRAHASRLRDLLGYSVVVAYPDGKTRTSDRLLTGEFEHRVDTRSAAALAQAIRSRLSAASRSMGGIRRARVSFRRPTALAPMLELDVGDVRKAAAYIARNKIAGDVEGQLIQLNDESGETIAVSAGSTRSKVGKLWVRSDYAP